MKELNEESLNLETIEKMVDEKRDYVDVHMHIFFFLMKFYHDSLPKKEATAFLKKMVAFSNEKNHSFKDHMVIFTELLTFYKENAEYSDFVKIQTISISFMDYVRKEIEAEKATVKQ